MLKLVVRISYLIKNTEVEGVKEIFVCVVWNTFIFKYLYISTLILIY